MAVNALYVHGYTLPTLDTDGGITVWYPNGTVMLRADTMQHARTMARAEVLRVLSSQRRADYARLGSTPRTTRIHSVITGVTQS